MNLDDFSYEENGRRYIDPNVSLNEQNAFIQNLRDTQAERNTQIAQQTHNLGTDVPSNLGGLTGSEAYFNARYQTPQTNSLVADLKATAQAQALNTALNNELEKAKKRYNDAYKASKSGGNGGNSNPVNGDVELVPVGDEYELRHKTTEGTLPSEGVPSTTLQREYYILGKNGSRTPLRVYNSGDAIGLQTPTGDMEGKDAVNAYMQKQLRNGGKLMVRDKNGKVSEVFSYHIQWGI